MDGDVAGVLLLFGRSISNVLVLDVECTIETGQITEFLEGAAVTSRFVVVLGGRLLVFGLAPKVLSAVALEVRFVVSVICLVAVWSCVGGGGCVWRTMSGMI